MVREADGSFSISPFPRSMAVSDAAIRAAGRCYPVTDENWAATLRPDYQAAVAINGFDDESPSLVEDKIRGIDRHAYRCGRSWS
jgi:hypothetical protein